ncbi:tryptophan synthase subunit alpha [bacterium]|nr:MAG: tryptophan synthase subunit alpha [bacterium]
MSRISRKFKELKSEGKKALVVFITAGYPSLGDTEKLTVEFAQKGADIIELGVPFSDPLADGPIIQLSSAFALEKKTNLDGILRAVRNIRKITQVPICLMSYYNPIFCFGEERFVKNAKACGVDGVIVPDLPPEEAKALIRYSRKYKLDTIFFVSPTSSLNRVKLVSKASKGFIYYVSLTGVTGPRQRLPEDLKKNIKLIKKYSKVPVCAGFGISSASQVREIQRIADGAIVGSAVISKIKDNFNKKDMVKRVGGFIASLKG